MFPTVVVLAAGLAAPPAVVNGTVEGEVAKKIDARLADLAGKDFSGVVLLALDGKVVLAKGYGFADRANKVPFTTDTPFDVGSVTKPFTAAAVLGLEADGKLKVTDPLAKYLTGVPEDKKGVTLHHLLTHTAGLPDSLGKDYDRVGRDEFVKLAFGKKLLSEPGKTYRYSNAGYSLLGAVIEEVTAGNYERYLRDKLFAPAGMTRTGYVLPKWDKAGLARGYQGEKLWGTPLDHAWADDGPYWHLRANGGLLSTAADLFRWTVALQGDDVLPKEAREKHFAPHVREGGSGDTHYAYGWSVRKTKSGRRVVEHNGSNGVFFADLRVYPDDKAVMLLATNGGGLKYLFELGTLERMVFGEQPKK